MLLNLKTLIDKYDLEINGIIHIGAHIGEEHLTYIDNGIKKILYFEPCKKNYNVLLQHVVLNENIQAIRCALGNRTGKIELNVDNYLQASNSILKPHLHLTQYPDIKFTSQEEVDIIRLDDFPHDNQYNFINIDVQGYELEVFKGGETTLQHISYILTEVNREELYENCVIVKELDNFLSNFDFKRRETNWAGTTWGDAFYTK